MTPQKTHMLIPGACARGLGERKGLAGVIKLGTLGSAGRPGLPGQPTPEGEHPPQETLGDEAKALWRQGGGWSDITSQGTSGAGPRVHAPQLRAALASSQGLGPRPPSKPAPCSAGLASKDGHRWTDLLSLWTDQREAQRFERQDVLQACPAFVVRRGPVGSGRCGEADRRPAALPGRLRPLLLSASSILVHS